MADRWSGSNNLDEHKVKLAMAVCGKNAHWKLHEIKAGHWDTVAKLAGLGDARAIVGELIGKTPAVLASVSKELPVKFPAHASDRIFAGLERSAKQLAGS